MGPALLLIGVILAMSLLVWFLGWLGGMDTEQQLTCPVLEQELAVHFDRALRFDWSPGAARDVVGCSAFPNAVTCGKSCLVDHPTAGPDLRHH